MTEKEIKERLAKAVATDLVSGLKHELVHKGRCHFFNRFRVGSYEVQLRLDWKDIIHGFPRLDADFYDIVTGGIEKSMRGHLAHHTDAAPTEKMHLYVWEYQDTKRHLRIDLSWWAFGSGHQISYGDGFARAVNPPTSDHE